MPTIDRETHAQWLMTLTAIPTASGREHRVCEWIGRWVNERRDLSLSRDPAGNLVVGRAAGTGAADKPALFITAHLDHPAFVVERIVGPGTVEAGFRGGVLTPYFKDAPVVLFAEARGDCAVRARVIETTAGEPWRRCVIELDDEQTLDGAGLVLGDIGRWDLPDPRIEGDRVMTHACDDLAAAAAALAAMDVLRCDPEAGHVRLLFTRAEEVGFVGAIAACKHGTMPVGCRVIALENSRSFPTDSPIGAGPIVRVGDRISTFSPALTSSVAKVAERLAVEKRTGSPAFRWQRKLMPGGACEASAYQAYGYEATCVCLPLGNYHNMSNLSAVQAEEPDAVANARAGHEEISLSDFHGLVELLVACGTVLGPAEPLVDRMDKLYAERRGVLE